MYVIAMPRLRSLVQPVLISLEIEWDQSMIGASATRASDQVRSALVTEGPLWWQV